MNRKDKMTYSDDYIISSMDELIEVINDMGFVPFFENEIGGGFPGGAY